MRVLPVPIQWDGVGLEDVMYMHSTQDTGMGQDAEKEGRHIASELGEIFPVARDAIVTPDFCPVIFVVGRRMREKFWVDSISP